MLSHTFTSLVTKSARKGESFQQQLLTAILRFSWELAGNAFTKRKNKYLTPLTPYPPSTSTLHPHRKLPKNLQTLPQYNVVFPGSLSVGHIFAVQTLGWAYDRLKKDLKNKAKLTDIEQRQVRLLEFPASKQFLICVAGALREEIAGTKVSEPKAFEVKDQLINAQPESVVEAWVRVLRSILPIIVQGLPAEEYQVVRSTDHTESVAKKTKGLIAGLDIIQSSFEDLRQILKTVH